MKDQPLFPAQKLSKKADQSIRRKLTLAYIKKHFVKLLYRFVFRPVVPLALIGGLFYSGILQTQDFTETEIQQPEYEMAVFDAQEERFEHQPEMIQAHEPEGTNINEARVMRVAQEPSMKNTPEMQQISEEQAQYYLLLANQKIAQINEQLKQNEQEQDMTFVLLQESFDAYEQSMREHESILHSDVSQKLHIQSAQTLLAQKKVLQRLREQTEARENILSYAQNTWDNYVWDIQNIFYATMQEPSNKAIPEFESMAAMDVEMEDDIVSENMSIFSSEEDQNIERDIQEDHEIKDHEPIDSDTERATNPLPYDEEIKQYFETPEINTPEELLRLLQALK